MAKELSILLLAKDMASKTIGHVSGQLGKIDTAGRKASRGMKILGASLAAVGVAAVVGLGAAIRTGISELAKTEVGVAQTKAVLASTGAAANVTAEGIDNLTAKLERTVAVEDDLVRSAANMMLTFTNVRNEAGAGNDVYDQSIATLADMSRALGTDMTKSAIQLGKALNDPVKGITALTKVGVTFTAAQKAEIKGLAGTGDAMKNLKNAGIDLTKAQKDQIKAYGPAVDTLAAAEGAGVKLTAAQRKMFAGMDDGTGIIQAQKIILAELNKEFGGSGAAYAETYAGTMAGLGFAVEGAQKALAIGFMPVISKVSKFLQEQLIKPEVLKGIEDAGNMLAGFFDEAAEFAMSIPWGTVVGAFRGIAAVAKTAVDAFRMIPPWAQQLLIGGFVANKLTGGAIGSLVSQLAGGLIKGVLGIQAGVVNVTGGVVNAPGGLGGGNGRAPLVPAAGAGLLATMLPAIAGAAAIAGLYWLGTQNQNAPNPVPDSNLLAAQAMGGVLPTAPNSAIKQWNDRGGVTGPGGGRGDKSTADEVKRLGRTMATMDGVIARAVAKGLNPTKESIAGTMAKNVRATESGDTRVAGRIDSLNAAVRSIKIAAPVVNVTLKPWFTVRTVVNGMKVSSAYTSGGQLKIGRLE